jgi:2-oxoisovalerate dehydrogenase E1 component
MGVYWAKKASQEFGGAVEVLDLRTLYPLDEEMIFERAKAHGRCLVLTEEPEKNGFAQGLAGQIQQVCFKYLDAPVMVLGSENMPAIPLNSTLEETMIPNAEKTVEKLRELAGY